MSDEEKYGNFIIINRLLNEIRLVIPFRVCLLPRGNKSEAESSASSAARNHSNQVVCEKKHVGKLHMSKKSKVNPTACNTSKNQS